MTAMLNADHLAGALTLELGMEVTWHPAKFSDNAIFECNGRLAIIGLQDLHKLATMTPSLRRALVKRMRTDLDPTS